MSDSDEDIEVTYSDNEGSLSPRSRGSRSASPASGGKSQHYYSTFVQFEFEHPV